MLQRWISCLLIALVSLFFVPQEAKSQCIDTVSQVLQPPTGADDYTSWSVHYPDFLSGCSGLSGGSGTDVGTLEIGPEWTSNLCNCVAPCFWVAHSANVGFANSIPADATVLSARLKLWKKGSPVHFIDSDIRVQIAGSSGSVALGSGIIDIDQDVKWLVQAALPNTPNQLVFQLFVSPNNSSHLHDYFYSTEDSLPAYLPTLEVVYSAPKQASVE